MRKYRTYKFIYTNDLGVNIIKRQRAYLDDNEQEITPITDLFLARVVNFQEKVTGTSQRLRSLLTYIAQGQFEAKLPYGFADFTTLRQHIEEILAVERVICGDYKGERLITGGITANIQQ